MEAGVRRHGEERRRERRRSLACYGLVEGERHEDVRLASARLGLSGRVDMVILCGENEAQEAIPVDYKDAGKVHGNWKDQLAAYALLLEEIWGLPVRRGFIYLLPRRRAVGVGLSGRRKEETRRLVTRIREMVETEQMPPPTPVRGRCVDCEFRRFCNDIF